MLIKTKVLQKLILISLSVWLFPTLGLAQNKPLQIPLWANGAPGFEDRRNEPEKAKDWWIRNIHNPSITVFLPPEKLATGTAVVICPGGGHRNLVYKAEGQEVAKFLNSIGVTAFVLKYRLAREIGSPYDLKKHVQQDAYRAMRLVRSRANEWGIDPNRLGMMGFSAGGEVVSSIAYQTGEGDPNAVDKVDRLNGKPNFQILIYPAPLWIPDKVPADAPPVFLLTAIGDPCCSESVIRLLQNYHQAGISAEAHIYARGDHAFGMGQKSGLQSISSWSNRLVDWMVDSKILYQKVAKK
jgi:acetyl esterase/lipase